MANTEQALGAIMPTGKEADDSELAAVATQIIAALESD